MVGRHAEGSTVSVANDRHVSNVYTAVGSQTGTAIGG